MCTTTPVLNDPCRTIGMNQSELEKRIASQDTWTFRECLALAAEFNMKTRMVIALILARGKQYVDQEIDQSQP